MHLHDKVDFDENRTTTKVISQTEAISILHTNATNKIKLGQAANILFPVLFLKIHKQIQISPDYTKHEL